MVQNKWLIAAKMDLRDIYDYISIDSKRFAKHTVIKIQNKIECAQYLFIILKVKIIFMNKN